MLVDTANSAPNIQLMEAEDALYWRMVCWHLQKEAQVSLPPFSHVFCYYSGHVLGIALVFQLIYNLGFVGIVKIDL